MHVKVHGEKCHQERAAHPSRKVGQGVNLQHRFKEGQPHPAKMTLKMTLSQASIMYSTL